MLSMSFGKKMAVKIAVVSVQGDFDEHLSHFKKQDDDSVEVYAIKNKNDLLRYDYDGLVFPGGESTTFRRVMESDRSFYEEFKKIILEKRVPVWGTCCGLILLANRINGDTDEFSDYKFSCLDISVLRNAYGSQNDSFISTVSFKDIERQQTVDIEGLFIRAPAIETVGEDVEIVATLPDTYKYPVVGVRKDNILATTFHPELTQSKFVHDYFVHIARKYSASKN